MDLEQLERQICDRFRVNGLVGGLLTEVLQAEARCLSAFVEDHSYYSGFMDSFQSFFIETLKGARQWVSQNGWPDGKWYSWTYLYYLVLFRSLRACEILLIHGYPYDAYGLVRDIKDRSILLAGVCHNITNFARILGCDESQSLAGKRLQDLKKQRKEEENKIRRFLVGSESGLAQKVQTDIRKWEELFHLEVHGSKLSLAQEVDTMFHQNRWPEIGPAHHHMWDFYTNRVLEVCWLVLRLLPYLQPTSGAFGREWREKYELLDETFRSWQDKWTKKRQLAGVIIELVDAKFTFQEPFFFFEPSVDR